MTRRSLARSCIKSISWGFVSFFVIGAFEVAAIAWREGWDAVVLVAPGLAIGLAVSCVGKIPFHLSHDHGWDRLFLARDAMVLRAADLAADGWLNTEEWHEDKVRCDSCRQVDPLDRHV